MLVLSEPSDVPNVVQFFEQRNNQRGIVDHIKS
jgi:hypothetical protein